jgi:NAD(P)-dependent dehydrogenase (short-subunit alcohol dehydrogenase family)
MSRKTVLITGCSSGFGHLLVPEFLREGWQVIATMRDANNRQAPFNKELQQYGDQLTVLSLDVTNEEERRAAGVFIKERFAGRLDCLVNNAGYGLFGAVEDLSEAQIRQQMEVNFFGLVLLTQRLLPQLRHSRGRIINISSVLGFMAMPMSVMYCASKFAVEGFSEGLAYELQPHGVQVALVEPGAFRTGFAEKLTWGDKSSDATSPYQKQTAAYRKYREKRASGEGTDPTPVIKAVLRLAEMKKMPMRVRCGNDAKAGYAGKRALPEFLQTKIFSSLYRKIFAGAKE